MRTAAVGTGLGNLLAMFSFQRCKCFQGSLDSSQRKLGFLDFIVYWAVKEMKVVGNAECYPAQQPPAQQGCLFL